jgi:hypothetical protein
MRSLSDLIYKVLLANAASFFGSPHANYDEGAGTALSATSLAVGIARMMAQRDDEHRDLDIRARTLLVPPELQQTAKELLQSNFILSWFSVNWNSDRLALASKRRRSAGERVASCHSGFAHSC